MNIRSIVYAVVAAVAFTHGVNAVTEPVTTVPATTVTSPSAVQSATKCLNVGVEGDATYCISGPVCEGKGDKPSGTNCPKTGDVAVANCLKTLKSYKEADKCIAPANAVCQKLKSDMWGCVWPSTSSDPIQVPVATTAPSATPAATTVKPANTTAPSTAPVATTAKTVTTTAPSAAPASTTVKPATSTAAPATTTTKPATPTSSTPASTTKAPSSASATPASNTSQNTNAKCINVSVEGDATYCIAGPICSGSGDKAAGTNCPKAGDVAVASCLKTLKSYKEADKCVAPVDAVCQKIKTGAWGCVWGAAKSGSTSAPTPAATTAKSAGSTSGPMPAATTTKPANSTSSAPAATTAKPANSTAPAVATAKPVNTTAPTVTSAMPANSTAPSVTPVTSTVKPANSTALPTVTSAISATNATKSANSTSNPVQQSNGKEFIEVGDNDSTERSDDTFWQAGVGAVAAVGAIAGIAVYRKRQQKQKATKSDALQVVTP